MITNQILHLYYFIKFDKSSLSWNKKELLNVYFRHLYNYLQIILQNDVLTEDIIKVNQTNVQHPR